MGFLGMKGTSFLCGLGWHSLVARRAATSFLKGFITALEIPATGVICFSNHYAYTVHHFILRDL
jgi:hypothetical protein